MQKAVHFLLILFLTAPVSPSGLYAGQVAGEKGPPQRGAAFRESFERNMGSANAVLAYEHQDLREMEKAVSGLQRDVPPAEILALAVRFIDKLSAHKEESVIFPLAKEMDLALTWEGPRPRELRDVVAYEI